MTRIFIALLLTITLAASPASQAFNSKCSLRITSCIATQGTKIPSDDVVEMLDRCQSFTRGNIGQLMLRTSGQKMMEQSNGKSTSLTVAWMDFDYLHGSALKFERKSRAEDTNYFEIKRSCALLERDFNDDGKWSK